MELIGRLNYYNIETVVYEPLHDELCERHLINRDSGTFEYYEDIKGKVDFLFSVGGDGTFLKTISVVRDSGIPVLGFNTGRLGFLSGIPRDGIAEAIESLLEKKFRIEQRTLLKISKPESLFQQDNFGLNEITVHKKDSSSMILIQAYVNDVLLNSYWADGLIIATPTGSTAYSLSCSGPILTPDSSNFLITPIASHNLTVRPVVVPDNVVIKLKIDSREENYLVTIDSKAAVVTNSIELEITKEKFLLNIVQLNNQTFFSTIREKLMWGLDKRN
jgi:NAD+ kinase